MYDISSLRVNITSEAVYRFKIPRSACKLRETAGFTDHSSWFSVLQNWATSASESGEQGIVPDRWRSKRTTIIKAQSHILLAPRLRLSGTVLQLTVHAFTIFLTPSTSRQDYFLDAFAYLRPATISFVMCVRLSVYPHGTTRLPPDGFSLNLIFEYFSNIWV